MIKLLRILFCILGAKSYTVYKNMNFIHLLLSQFFTVIFQFRTLNSLQNYHNFLSRRSNVIVISKRLHNVLYLACVNWEYFQGIKIYDTMPLNVQNSVRTISPLDSITSTHMAMWHLFIIMKSMTEFSTSCNTCIMPFPTHTWWLLFFFLFYFWKWPKQTFMRNSALSDLELNQCWHVVKACLKPAYN